MQISCSKDMISCRECYIAQGEVSRETVEKVVCGVDWLKHDRVTADTMASRWHSAPTAMLHTLQQTPVLAEVRLESHGTSTKLTCLFTHAL